MDLLIIGGTGVLSSAVTSEAIKAGIDVTMINRGNRPIPSGVKHIKANKDDLHKIADALQGRMFDAVMDFLCVTKEQTEKSVRFYSQYCRQYIYISSSAVYNTEVLAGKIGVEDSPKILAAWDYSIGKWKSEELIMNLLVGADVKYTIIRPCVTYDDTRIPYGISPMYGYHWTICARALAGKPIIRWNHGVNRCNMMRVEDFAIGVVGLIGNKDAYNEAFNICGDETPSWNDVLKIVSEYLGKEIITIDIPSDFYALHYPSKAGEIFGRSLDSINSNNKIKRIVPSFKQTITLTDGIIKTLEAYKTYNYQRGIDWLYDAITDRVVSLFLKQNDIDPKLYKLEFVDYLGTSRINDRVTYYCARKSDNPFIIDRVPRLFRKLTRIL